MTILCSCITSSDMLSFMQMKYELIRGVIFYSGGFTTKQGTHLSLVSLVSHVIWDWSERLPATHLCADAWCHCHSPTIVMCVSLSTSINITLGRHACKWKSLQDSKRGKGKSFIYVLGVHEHLKDRTRVIDFFISLSRLALIKMSLNSSFKMQFLSSSTLRLTVFQLLLQQVH